MNSPYLLLPYQQRWIADKSPIKVIEKSRRIGISWAEAADDALLASEEDGSDVYYIGYNEDMARLWMEDVAWWAKNYQLAASPLEQIVIQDDEKDILAYQIRFASGHKVTALSSRPSNLRGKQGKVVIDEAAFHPSLSELLKAAIALLMWGGSIAIISTHDGIDNQFNKLIEEIRSAKKDYSLHRVTIDDALVDGLYQRICLSTKNKKGKVLLWTQEAENAWRQQLFSDYGDDATEELLCIPRSNSDIYLSSVLVEGRMSAEFPVLRLSLTNDFEKLTDFEKRESVNRWIYDHLQVIIEQLPRNLRTYYGMDFGRTGDLSVIAPIVENNNLSRYCPFLVEMRNVPIRQQEQVLYYIVDRLPNFRGGSMDGRGNGQAIAEFAKNRYGSRIEAMMLTAEKYRLIMPRYKTGLEDGVLTIPKDSDVLSDHRAVKLEQGVPKIPDTGRYRGSDGSKRHGDSLIALVLGYHAAIENAGVCSYTESNSNLKKDGNRNFGRNIFTSGSTGVSPSRKNVRDLFG